MDLAGFRVGFTDGPGVIRRVRPFSPVPGHSRRLRGRSVSGRSPRTVMRRHIAASGAMGGAPGEIPHDRMKTAVIGEEDAGVVTHSGSPVAPLNRYGSARGARKPYRARTKGRVERPFRYFRRDLFAARTFRNTDDPDARSDAWRHGIASPRVQATAERVVDEALAGGVTGARTFARHSPRRGAGGGKAGRPRGHGPG